MVDERMRAEWQVSLYNFWRPMVDEWMRAEWQVSLYNFWRPMVDERMRAEWQVSLYNFWRPNWGRRLSLRWQDKSNRCSSSNAQNQLFLAYFTTWGLTNDISISVQSWRCHWFKKILLETNFPTQNSIKTSLRVVFLSVFNAFSDYLTGIVL